MKPTDFNESSTRGLLAWSLFDWANSAFPTVITTFVFAAYFTGGFMPDKEEATAAWGVMISLSAVAIAILGPICGAIADHRGRRKPWVFIFTALCIIASALLWLAEPGAISVVLVLLMVGLANFAFEMGMVFYNAMLPDLAPKSHLGRWSGWAWGLGYFGGLTCLAVTLVGFVQAEVPWFGLDKDTFEHLRITGPLVAVWMALFSLPLWFFTPDKPATGMGFLPAIGAGLKTLKTTLINIRKYRDIAGFLIARMIYTDGLNTLFAFGGIYAVGSFGFSFTELILFGIGMNVTAGIGAFGFSFVDDRIGSKKVILIAVAVLAALGTALLIVESKTLFWVFGLPLGIFVGPAQSASRTLMARMAPEDLRTEMFGLFALSGKATAFIGPALLAWVTLMFDSQRAGMATIMIFFVVGFILMLRVPDVRE